jgi:hypothetical protein
MVVPWTYCVETYVTNLYNDEDARDGTTRDARVCYTVTVIDYVLSYKSQYDRDTVCDVSGNGSLVLTGACDGRRVVRGNEDGGGECFTLTMSRHSESCDSRA